VQTGQDGNEFVTESSQTSLRPKGPATRFVAWNIHAAADARRGPIVDVLVSLQADVLVLSEASVRFGAAIVPLLVTAGFTSVVAAPVTGHKRGVLVASRWPLSLGPLGGCPMPDRWLHIRGADLPVEIGGLYLPGAAGGLKPAFWTWLRTSASYLVDRPAILIGDLNTGTHEVDEPGAEFLCNEDFDALSNEGWIDAWRSRHADSGERTWWAPQGNGNGFRLDHVFATASANPLVTQAEYVTDVGDVPLVRTGGYRIKDGGTRPLSDHAALLVDIGPAR